MHISSLPGPYGIGTMGDNAYRFVDFLQRAGQTWWQILPIGPTSYGDSPYQSFSSVAGNPYFIDLPQLERDGLLERSEYEALPWCESEITVDYGRLYELRYRVLHHAYRRFTQNPPEDFRRFCEENVRWLPDYALFMALKDAHGGRPWNEWEQPLKVREPAAIAAAREQYKQEIGFQMMLQYLFTRQWRALKGYANERGIRIIGDIPITCRGIRRMCGAPRSSSCWMRTMSRSRWQAARPTGFPPMVSFGAIRCSAGRPCGPTATAGGSTALGPALRCMM